MQPALPTAALDALEFDAMTPEEQQSLLDHLGELLASSSLMRFMEMLGEPERDELAELLKRDDDGAGAQAFFEAHAEQVTEASHAAATELADDILAVTGHQPA